MRSTIEIELSNLTAVIALIISLSTAASGAAFFAYWYHKTKYHLKRPYKFLLIRHTESEGNVDDTAYAVKGDPLVRLTQRGREQAKKVGIDLHERVGDRPVFVYISPYVRTRETAEIALRNFPDHQIKFIKTDIRLREQEFSGTFQQVSLVQESKKDREKFSKFFYRFQGGESSADVFDRVSLFNETMWRDFAKNRMDEGVVLIFGHGLINRLFIMRWFNWQVDLFEKTKNPGNGAILELTRENVPDRPGRTRYRLSDESMKILQLDKAQFCGVKRSPSERDVLPSNL